MNRVPNSSMPKSIEETLKLIQKQGLSISIAGTTSRPSQPIESPIGAKEMKPKQFVTVDKSTKLPNRSTVVTDNKATLSQARPMHNPLPVSEQQTPSSSHFQDNKISGIVTKTLVPISASSETRVWNNSPATENKLHNQINQPIVDNKNLLLAREQLARLEAKNQNAKAPPIVSEGIKLQNRISQVTSQPSNVAGRTIQESLEATSTRNITMSSPKVTPKRPQAGRSFTNSPVPKKKCVKKMSPNASQQISGMDNLEARTPKGINMQNRGLTITPVTSTPSATNKNVAIDPSLIDTSGQLVKCQCGKYSSTFDYCQYCRTALPSNAPKFRLKKVKNDLPITQQPTLETVMVTKNVTTTSIEKKIVYHLPDGINQYQSISMRENVVFETSSPLGTRGGRGRARGRRKAAEPVCLTLSSDDEEQPMYPSSLHSSQIYNPIESEGSKSDHSSASEMMHHEFIDEKQEDSDEFPGVTDINPSIEEEEEPEEEMEYEEEEEIEQEEPFSEECEEEEEEEHTEEIGMYEQTGKCATDYPLRCRSIRIGSYKVHPPAAKPYVAVILSHHSISFNAPVISDPDKLVHITLGSEDVQRMYAHFGRCLPVIFINTTPKFGDLLRKALHMVPNETPYFDPTSTDDKTQRLTLLIESMPEDQRTFIRMHFPGEKKLTEIDQKQANEILVKSTPNQNTVLQLKRPDPVPVVVSTENQLPQISNQISVTKVNIPPKPVVKLLTYPAPPMTGGIAITNEDLNCLNEGEFLNDAIIDFYLKYLFHEKLSPYYQERTHIFSSFFYPRLTHKQERPRGDDVLKTMPVRRHNQVKTWTRHVDIFSKDYIIIPVNQNVHWFLAIICYPSKVPDAPNEPENKLNDSVTSTNEQTENNTQHKVTIKEITSNGEDDSPNPDENSMNSTASSPYEVEEPPDSDECSETPDSTTNPDGKLRKEMPCICIFDSLSGPSRVRIATVLREYLELEWKCKKGTKKLFNKNTMQGFVVKCPQQTNFSDCGIYLLQYVESFFENPIPFCNPMPDLTDWFTEEKINRKRQQLKDLILNLQKKQEAALASRKNQSASGSSQHSDNR